MKMLRVARREYLERVRKKTFLIGTILGPVLMGAAILVPGLIFELSPEKQKSVAVIDSTGSIFKEFSEALSDTLESGTPLFKLRNVQFTQEDMDVTRRSLAMEVESDVIDGYIVIPKDIVEEGSATFYGKRVGDVKSLERIESALSTAVSARRLSGEGMDYGQIRRLLRNVELETIQLHKGEERKGEFLLVYFTTFIFIMMLYFTILFWGVAVMRSIVEEKNNRVIEVLLSSLRSFDLMGGKILGVGSVGLTQYAIWAAFALSLSFYGLSTGMLNQYVTFSWVTIVFFVVYYVLGFMFYSTIFASIGSVCNTDQEAQQLQVPVSMCLVFTLIIPMAILRSPDGSFATVVSMIPFFTPIVMFMRINILMPPIWQVALSIAILLGSIYISGMLAAKIFRIGILMYGKRPSLPEILKWLRRAKT
ncbi:MAG: ABC transporter permease [bacterium]|nr:MAG: ABC transporter permease [bacterium]